MKNQAEEEHIQRQREREREREKPDNQIDRQTDEWIDRRTDGRTDGFSLEGAEQKAKEAGSRILINGIDPCSFAYVNRGAGV